MSRWKRQDQKSSSDASPAETGKPRPTPADDAAKTAAPTKAAETKKSGSTKAAKGGTQKTKDAATKTSTVDPRLAPGAVQMITPAPFDQASYYKAGDYVTFAWNYTKLLIEPAKIDVLVSCQANSATYTISNNASFNPTGKVVWDTKPEVSGTAPLLTETYTLIIHDASEDITAVPKAGHLQAYNQLQFGMYKPQPYTPLKEGWQCATCSGALSTTDQQALTFMLGMCIITVLSFTCQSKKGQPAVFRDLGSNDLVPYAQYENDISRLSQDTYTVAQLLTNHRNCTHPVVYKLHGKHLCESEQANMPAGQPRNWTDAMTTFLKKVLADGEDNKSALILLETEFPHMINQVSLAWVNRVKKGEL
ncbi:MAG: hypothetical protein Q9209_000870 [Squamulea sp. 1 TL-2023]